MIHTVSKILAKSLVKATHLYEEEDNLRFGIEVLIGYSFKIIVLFLISYFWGITTEMIFLTVTFAMIRIFSGGDHLTTYFSCFVFSLFWLCFLSWVALKLSGIPGKQLLLFIHFSLIFGLLICFRYGSKQREKDTIKPITPSMIIVGVWYFFILLGCLFNVHSSYLMASILGLWLQLISLTPLGTRGIKLLNQKIKGEF